VAIFVNLAPVLLPAAAITFIADFRTWVLADWRWLWLGAALFGLLATISSFRQHRVLHPLLDIEIDANRQPDVETLHIDGWPYTVITLPQVVVNTYNTTRIQLEFRLLGAFGELGPLPFGGLVAKHSKLTHYMTNPKVFGEEPGDHRQDLGFAETLDKLGHSPQLEGLRLRFRDRTRHRSPWHEFPVPGEFHLKQ
jgi:hypothetical protein